MDYKFLNDINSPSDIKKLSHEEISVLSDEIRDFLVKKTQDRGGHLASNLGVVELTLAMHRVFDSPSDHFIFDVGHQAYVHKIITGRRTAFDTLRLPGGLCGFTSRNESEHDSFGAGHSSTSISAALGFARADKLSGSNSNTVAVIGDGAYTGGMAHEALNNVDPNLRLVVILNENGMSISSNKGAFASYIAKVRISKGYVKCKAGTISFLNKLPFIGKPIHTALSFIKNKIKRIIYSTNYFEELGFYYIGPVDGNDFATVERALKEAKRLGKAVLVHIKTQKGKGYSSAEKSPDEFHSMSSKKDCTMETFHSIAADALLELGERSEKVVAITAAMGIGTGLYKFSEKYPDRYFDVGIAEPHALTFSAGFAAAKYKPYCAIYSTFLQRGYDSILHDIALQKLPVRMLIDRAGISSGDGATHHGIFDVSFLSHIPNVKIYAPATYGSLVKMLDDSLETDSPLAIRYSNCSESSLVRERFYHDEDYGNYGIRADFDIQNPPPYVFVTYGKISENVIRAADSLEALGYDVGVILLEIIKPYSLMTDFILSHLSESKRIIFVEEGIKNGGAGMICKSELLEKGLSHDVDFEIFALDDNFVIPNNICDIYDYAGLSVDKLTKNFISGAKTVENKINI